MKVMVVGTIAEITQEQQQHYVPLEVAAILKLYLAGKMEQFWGRTDVPGAIILLDVESMDEARSLLDASPFSAEAGHLRVDTGRATHASRHFGRLIMGVAPPSAGGEGDTVHARWSGTRRPAQSDGPASERRVVETLALGRS